MKDSSWHQVRQRLKSGQAEKTDDAAGDHERGGLEKRDDLLQLDIEFNIQDAKEPLRPLVQRA